MDGEYKSYLEVAKRIGKEEEIKALFDGISSISDLVNKDPEITTSLTKYAYAYLSTIFLSLYVAQLEDKKSSITDPIELSKITENINNVNKQASESADEVTKYKELLDKAIGEYNKKAEVKVDVTSLRISINNLVQSKIEAIDKAVTKEISRIKDSNVEDKKQPEETKSDDIDYKKKYEELIQQYEELKNKYEDNQSAYQHLKEELAELKEEINDRKIGTKINKVKDKIVSGFKKTKRKVIAVKDYVVNWTKEHPKATKIIKISLITVAGLAAYSAIYAPIFGTPFAGIGRCCSGLYNVLQPICAKANITWPLNALHGVNKVLFGRFSGAVFNNATGVWTLGGKAINNLGTFETILRSVEGGLLMAAPIVGATRAIKKGIPVLKEKIASIKNKERESDLEEEEEDKKSWLKRAKEKFCINLKSKISNLKNKIVKKIKSKIEKHNSYNEIYEDYLECPLSELENDIADMEGALASESWPEDLDDYTPEEVEKILKIAKKALKKRGKTTQVDDEISLSEIEEMDEEQIDAILADLESVYEKVEQGILPVEFDKPLKEAHGRMNVDEVRELYELLEETKRNKFGKGVSK